MSTVLEPPTTQPVRRTPAGQRLQSRMAAARLSFTWLGVRRTLTPEQKAVAADQFGAHGSFLSAGKKLLDTGHAAFRDVTAMRGQIQNYFRLMSLPFPEAGIRLVRQDQLTEFSDQLSLYRNQLAEAVDGLDGHYPELKANARQRLGDLFNPSDYPGSLVGLFSVDWDFPAVEAPDYLRQINPELYEQEQSRIVARFDEAVRLAEEAFLCEFNKLVSHLVERISGAADGKPKVFRDTAVTNLHDFFERFKSLSVRSNEDLEQVIERAQQLLKGIEPQDLRDSQSVRRDLSRKLTSVQSGLDGLLVDRPRRSLIRPNRSAEAAHD